MEPIIVIGMGELGSAFAQGWLKAGHPVIPVLRQHDLQAMAQHHPAPAAVLIAVAEKDIQQQLAQLPTTWRDRLILIQNELLPRDWQAHDLDNPTVVSVWFEKKKGQLPKVVQTSVVYGPHSTLVLEAYHQLELPARALVSAEDLAYELVLKNLYIQTTNFAGLKVGGTVSELASQHAPLMQAVADDVLLLQSRLTGMTLDHARLMDDLAKAFAGDPLHKCLGRTAPARLARALSQAQELGLYLPTLASLPAQ